MICTESRDILCCEALIMHEGENENYTRMERNMYIIVSNE